MDGSEKQADFCYSWCVAGHNRWSSGQFQSTFTENFFWILTLTKGQRFIQWIEQIPKLHVLSCHVTTRVISRKRPKKISVDWFPLLAQLQRQQLMEGILWGVVLSNSIPSVVCRPLESQEFLSLALCPKSILLFNQSGPNKDLDPVAMRYRPWRRENLDEERCEYYNVLGKLSRGVRNTEFGIRESYNWFPDQHLTSSMTFVQVT